MREHEHRHEHGGAGEQGHGGAGEQGHAHEHGNAHEHEHDHAGEYTHGHDHEHGDVREHGHAHEHGNAHEHGHGHTHDHAGEHGHTHDHTHAHEHEHDHDHSHSEDMDRAVGAVRAGHLLHEEAIAASGDLILMAAEYAPIRAELDRQMTAVADSITAAGGIIGHIKASASVTSVEMFSVTDTDQKMAKVSPALTIDVHLAAIVFAVVPDIAEDAVRDALIQVKAAAFGG